MADHHSEIKTYTTATFSRFTSPSSFFERRVSYRRGADGYHRTETTVEVVETKIPYDTLRSDTRLEKSDDSLRITLEDLRVSIQKLSQLCEEMIQTNEDLLQIIQRDNERMQAHVREAKKLNQSVHNSSQSLQGSGSEKESPSQFSEESWYSCSSESSEDSWSADSGSSENS